MVLATHERAALLRRTLAALAAQTRPPDHVVVVDDGSADDTPAVLAAAVRAGDLPLQVIRLEENAGPGAARNCGWRATPAAIVAFTDDDCRPGPEWLERLMEVIGEVDVAQGRVVPDVLQTRRGAPFSRTLDVGGSPFFETANIAYRRELLERLGGFDERMRRGEDTDLGQRAVSAGARTAYDPDAVVVHEVFPMDLRTALRNAGHCYWVVRAVRTHPDLRQHFWGPLLLLPHHRYTLGAAAGVLIGSTAANHSSPAGRTARLLVGATAAAPWLRLRLRRRPTVHGKCARILWLPAQFLVELAEIAAVLRARHGYTPDPDAHGTA